MGYGHRSHQIGLDADIGSVDPKARNEIRTVLSITGEPQDRKDLLEKTQYKSHKDVEDPLTTHGLREFSSIG